MTKPINLRQARKRKARDDKAEQANTNRLAHRQPKSVTDLANAQADKAARELDGKKLGKAKPADPGASD
jgi:hypothetical protein